MIDARFLIDVHFRQGGKKDKDNFSNMAEAAGTGTNPPPDIPQRDRTRTYLHQTEEWHTEEERLGGAESQPDISRRNEDKSSCR